MKKRIIVIDVSEKTKEEVEVIFLEMKAHYKLMEVDPEFAMELFEKTNF